MANALYPKFKTALLKAGLDLSTVVIRAVLVNTTAADGTGNFYTYAATHEFLDSVPSAARIGAPQSLANKTFTAPAEGVFDADDVTFPAVTGSNAEALVIYAEGTLDTNRRLIAFIDTATGLPVTPNGGDITVTWDSGANRIFAL